MYFACHSLRNADVDLLIGSEYARIRVYTILGLLGLWGVFLPVVVMVLL